MARSEPEGSETPAHDDGTGKRCDYQHYTQAQRQAVMLLALETSVTKASEQHGVPVSTLYSWFENGGGLAEIRRISEESMLRAQREAGQAVFDAVAKKARAGELPDSELVDAFGALIAGHAKVAASASSPASEGTAFTADTISVYMLGADGVPELVDVPLTNTPRLTEGQPAGPGADAPDDEGVDAADTDDTSQP